MADGTVTMAEGFGYKALDSNEMRRKQKSISEQINSNQLLPQQSGNPNSSIPILSDPQSIKNSSPSRKLQQVFEQALIREAEERSSHLQVKAAQFDSQQKQVQNSGPNPKILYNARGNPYEEGDPNMGYSAEDARPRARIRANGSFHPFTDFTPSSTTHNLNTSIPHSQNQGNTLPNQDPQTSLWN
ncbi:hypothetical protein RHGRI_020837 [Rhododendron griersonianum]|uniref:Uncharacterized protein n=1 Tax=Rhododendron griersonianum TaxID=479676 RepID=A0AAV6JI06_9ERIC|nr:hypothetical protein RHGRI_020837 [Rhododendron griersonianum]